MNYLGLNEIREKYLSFFESKGHLRLPSFSLVPQNDKSILLINAGMTPLKPYFKGEEIPPRTRVTTSQKCIRTPDIERIGKTARHGTFFEMLGNFSFGDYFKKEVIPWAWEFLTEVMEIPAERLYITVFNEDEEAYDIWNKVVGVPASHIYKFGKEENFWEHGEGPCGPCSEIHFDRGIEYGCGKPDCKVGCDCDRFMEIWNLVFTQFNNDGNGNYTRLKNCNIDTGMGLERLACVMQGVDSLFDVDTVKNITNHLSNICSVKYGENHTTDVSLRIITDHIRSATFMVSDGILPSNEGRGYVVRRLLRRAARHGKLLGITKDNYLSELSKVVIKESFIAYPELKDKENFIINVIDQEEFRFNQTIDSGLEILNDIISQLKINNKTIISGDDAFKLYDTYGFPLDLTIDVASENGLSVDEDGFNNAMASQKKRARDAYLASGDTAWKTDDLLNGIQQTDFCGYDVNESDAKVLKINYYENSCSIITDVTPFYGEGGGQVGDIGYLSINNESYKIIDTKKEKGIYSHFLEAKNVAFSEGDIVHLSIDTVNRNRIRKNHTSVHLLQSALKIVLGDHVAQAGSYVDSNRLRFDFSHFKSMTKDEIREVESIVNNYIFNGYEVHTDVLPISEAKKSGAIALFGEKYGEFVRVVSIADVSKEFCGGTHIDNVAKIGLFKILSETGVAAGVRRIEAITGDNILSYLEEQDNILTTVSSTLKTNNSDLITKAESIIAELKDKNRIINELNNRISLLGLDEIIKNSELINDTLFISGILKSDLNSLRNITDDLKIKYTNAVIILFSDIDNKVSIAVSCGSEAIKKGNKAGNIAKEAANICGGGGGGRPDSATAGGKNIDMIPEAIKTVRTMII